jgi:glycosyltransferase involved in cell wall biosynthesis
MPANKLLVVTDEMEVGGSQRQIAYLLGELDHSRWKPELLFFRNESFLVGELRAQGITVHHLPKKGRFDLGFAWRYSALLRRQRYDLVHAFSLTAELWTLVASLLVRRPARLVSSVRGLYLAEPEWFWRIKRLIIRRSAAVIANARAGAVAAAGRGGVPVESFDVVPNGIVPLPGLMPGEREALRNALGVPAGRTFGLFVGRLVKEKNVACLMRAMAALPSVDRPWIALAGGGPLREEIESMREMSGLTADVRLIGERSDATNLMKAADFLVLPSAYEGMSNVLMEAMSAGCPVVASDVGGNPELVEDEVTGLLFPNDDDAALALRLERLSSDAGLRARLSLHAGQRARMRYSVAQLAASTMAVYDRCLSAPGSRHAIPATMLPTTSAEDT